MGLAVIYSRASVGIDAPLVSVEVHISRGMPGFSLVGLPETTVKEAKDRVRSAIINSYFEFPSKKITVNLAPADLPKEGARFDLPIALGILAASQQVTATKLEHYEFIGELALCGDLRSVTGVLPAAIATHNMQRGLILPQANASQAALIAGTEHLAASTLLEVCSFLNSQTSLSLVPTSIPADKIAISAKLKERDLQDIIGQDHGKRALEIAAAGGHNLLFLGPPGTGKTMLAMRLCDLLPPMSDKEALEAASILSLTQTQIDETNWKNRPFRAPHHSSSMAALVGGGSTPKPGEISLAHNGLLFLDEMPEFDRKVLDSLREPLESGEIVISRARGKTTFPAQFQLVGALNPSQIGHYDDKHMQADPKAMLRYLNRISAPLLDRFDMSLEIATLPAGMLTDSKTKRGESTKVVKERVQIARDLMLERAGKINSLLNNRELDLYCKLQREDQIFLEQALHKLGLSIRAYHRIIKVARTIADLNREQDISRGHLIEALGYRAMDRFLKYLRSFVM